MVKNRLVIHLGACVRELRQEAGLSQVELAERCGFYQTYLSRLERGIANPTLHAMEVVANTLGLTLTSCSTGSGRGMPVKAGPGTGQALLPAPTGPMGLCEAARALTSLFAPARPGTGKAAAGPGLRARRPCFPR
jgi:transcriptional regulator with XRE-family HTH domain